MSFSDQVKGFSVRLDAKVTHRVFPAICAEVTRSGVHGSEITGAPGQPVASGRLKSSFIPEFKSASVFEITTDVPYAPIIEDNARGAQLRSSVGGFHSWELTRVGFPHIVAHVVAEMADG